MHAKSPASMLGALATVVLAVSTATAQPSVTDLEGRPVAPLGGSVRATVLIFTAVECPISDRYAPEVRRLAEGFATAGVRVWLVYANAGESAAAVRAHATAFGLQLPVAIDTGAGLADQAGAEVTPEAAVFDRDGRVAYRGRIDDRYVDFGVDRLRPTRHDLADAVNDVLAGRPVQRPIVPAVGCAIVRQRP